ncbi:hypothetical protein [Hirschia maritima]|uniref:hypothetical protein n=1 Tax=Hirschia maritima TaxID=1121961 RepID=UPI0005268194|nr:hypothetical protein [Hirschia maritima]
MSSINTFRSCMAGAVAAIALSACNPIEQQESISMDVGKPSQISFGSTVSEIQTALNGYCSSVDVRQIDPPSIPNVESQWQIDCQGFGYFGDKRLAEFVFVNDALMLTWILVEADEIPALEKAFTAKFGAPTTSKDTILAYANNFAAVRNDTPEALYYSETAAPFVMDRINKLPDRD